MTCQDAVDFSEGVEFFECVLLDFIQRGCGCSPVRPCSAEGFLRLPRSGGNQQQMPAPNWELNHVAVSV